jgi:hypothetical protein
MARACQGQGKDLRNSLDSLRHICKLRTKMRIRRQYHQPMCDSTLLSHTTTFGLRRGGGGLLTACRGRHITSPPSWCPASAEHREPIVPRAVRRNASRSPRVRRGACQAHRRNRLLHAYCNRIQMFGCGSEAWKAEVTKGLVRPPRCRPCWRQMVATLWGGFGCTQCFSTSLHRPNA